jgi:hypothetical protein
MLNFNPFIVKENDVFYFDVEEYNSKSDLPIEETDLIRFEYEGERYLAKVVSINGKKNDFFMLEIINKK